MALSKAELPTTSIPDGVKNLLNEFYALGDTNTDEASDRLGKELFTPSGQIVIGKTTLTGAAEISKTTRGFLQALKGRRHEVQKIYTCNEAGDDLLLVGHVTWHLPNDEKLEGEYCARAVIEDAKGSPKLKLYQGWGDFSELLKAMPPPPQ